MRKLLQILTGGAVMLGVASVQANLIPTLNSLSAEGSNWRFSYQSDVTLDQKVLTGDYFTIYDFAGFVPGSDVAPAGWSLAVNNTGITPALTAPPDDPALPNLTWTYTGAPTILGPQSLGLFTALSEYGVIDTGFFAGRATRSTGPDTGTKIANVGNVTVPIVSTTPVPEGGATFVLLGLAIGAFSFVPRRSVSV